MESMVPCFDPQHKGTRLDSRIRTDQTMYTNLVFSVLKIVHLDPDHPNEINIADAIFRSPSGLEIDERGLKVK